MGWGLKMQAGGKPSRQRQIWLSIGTPIFLLNIVVCVGGIFLLAEFARRQDSEFVVSTQRLAASAIEGQARALSNTTKDYALWNDAFNAITLDWDAEWVEENYVSAIADGLVVFREDRRVRYSWSREMVDEGGPGVAAAVAERAASAEELNRISAAALVEDMTISRLIAVGERPVLVAVAPVSFEDEARRGAGRQASEVDFVASVDVLNAYELLEIGDTLGLRDLAFSASLHEPEHESGHVHLALPDGEGANAGYLTWRNERPGSASFLSNLWPMTLFLLLTGIVTVLLVRRSVARQLEAMAHADAAAEANQAKSSFIATMSHELRAPLDAIIGYAELLSEEHLDRGLPELSADSEKIQKAGMHLLQLINDILDHSKIDADKLTLQPDHLRAEEILAEVVNIIEPLARDQGDKLRTCVEDGVAEVFADHMRLRQCLLNLASNAVKFTRNGAVTLHVRNGQKHGRGFVVFDVIDTGIGIAPDALTSLFAPFEQTDRSITREYGGAGLGLSITRKLARAMGGDVFVASAIGQGSTFSLWIPAAAEAELTQAA